MALQLMLVHGDKGMNLITWPSVIHNVALVSTVEAIASEGSEGTSVLDLHDLLAEVC